jgi:hypothetical protein
MKIIYKKAEELKKGDTFSKNQDDLINEIQSIEQDKGNNIIINYIKKWSMDSTGHKLKINKDKELITDVEY